MEKVNIDELESLKDRLVVADNYSKTIGITDWLCSLLESVCPGIGLIKQVANANLMKFQELKQKEFCDIILTEPQLITSEKIQDVDFIMSMAKALEVINRTSQNDKVKYIANLFKKSFVYIDKYNLNQYEEFLHRLDYLSLREIDLLIGLYKYSKNSSQKYHEEWYTYKALVAEKLGLSKKEIVSIFNGLCMTGFCASLNVLFPSEEEEGDDQENAIYVTAYFKRFLDLIS